MNELLKFAQPELLKEWHPSKNQGISLDTLRVRSSKKVWWQCLVDPRHQWETRVRRRAIDGTGCPYCSRRRVLSDESFAGKHPNLAAQLHPTKNGNFDPFSVSPASEKPVWWICPRNPQHIWQARIATRIRHKSGCKHCRRSQYSVATKYPTLAREWHPTRNKLQPSDVSASSHLKVWWRCGRNPRHVWRTRIDTRTRGMGGACPYCRKSAGPQRKLSLAEYAPQLVSEWHPSKNANLTPQDVLCTSHAKVWWLCPKNPKHEWQAAIRNRAKLGVGCPHCSSLRPATGESFADLYPQLAKEWHPIKNGSLRPQDVTRGSAKLVWWQCANDSTHIWKASVTSRTSPRSRALCPFCSGHIVTAKNSLAAHHPEIAKEWHFEKNGDLTPENVPKAGRKKVWWQCSRNPAHVWQTQIKNRTVLGSGCPQCAQDDRVRRLQLTLIEAASADADVLMTFDRSIKVLRRLLKQDFPRYLKLQQPLYRMLYVSAVTSMEAYLSDAFSQLVLRYDALIEKLLRTTPEFQDRKYALSEVIDWQRQTHTRVREYLYDVVWHNVAKVSQMYANVLGVSFPKDMNAIFRAVTTRHDLVHRNGRTKKGSMHRFTGTDVEEIFRVIEEFVVSIDGQVKASERSLQGIASDS